MRGTVIVTVAALIGCHEEHPTVEDAGADVVDAAVRGPCWPNVERTPKGWASLGTGSGSDGFEVMPEVLPLEYGTQDGYNLVAHVRMSGFAPGNSEDVTDPGNLRTRIRSFFVDPEWDHVPLNYYANCPFRYAYIPSPQGDYEFIKAVPIIFDTCWRPVHLFGKQIRIELEILDDSGGYTTDVKVVTAAPPTGFYPEEPDSPGCIHPPRDRGIDQD